VLIRKDGSRLTVSSIASPIVTDGRRVGLVVVLRDISDRIAQEAELKQQREWAEEASRHKTRLLSGLSHDARTPLNAVVLAAQLLEIHFDGEPDSEVQECLRTIRHSVKNVLDLLGDLLNLSKIEAGAVPPEVSSFPLEPVLAECLASIETQARMKGLDIHLDPGNLARNSLATDRAKLKQIVGNFLSNAVRYTERGGIRLVGEHRDGQVRIAVADTGVGIEPGDQGRIFDEFAVLEHPRRSIGEGTGLGLAICRRLAKLLGGEITLASIPGRGSTFTLVLPDTVLTQCQIGPAPDDPPARPRAEVGAILVAEDHPESRKTLSKVLRRMGYRVLEASNGRDALDLIRSERPLAVLMDVNMPIMNGVDATLALRANPEFRDLPIFALTGDVTPDNQHRIGEAGVSGYLEKPVTWDLLKQALASLGHPTPD
jgi:signal transduction histidine kinase/CheY-like chemotaxis protein